MESKANALAALGAEFVGANGVSEHMTAPRFRYDYQLVRDGKVIDQWSHDNLVTTVGGNDLLDKYFAGSAYTAAWYLGLISSVGYTTGPALTDTMSSHSAWNEAQGATNVPDYANGTRPAITFSTAASAKSKTSTSAVNFVFSSGGTVKGGFITSNSTKNGTTGILYSAGTFTDRTVVTNDQLNVTVTVTC